MFWWFQYRFNPRHRYHVVNTGLKPGYHENDELMLHANFAILVNFVEREHPHKRVPPRDVDELNHRPLYREVFRLYRWWTRHRPNRPELIWGDWRDPNSEKIRDECFRLEDEWEKEDQDMLLRLVKIRKFLWT